MHICRSSPDCIGNEMCHGREKGTENRVNKMTKTLMKLTTLKSTSKTKCLLKTPKKLNSCKQNC